jgi:hypothetical protein
MAEVVKHLCGKCKALSSNSNTAKRRKEGRNLILQLKMNKTETQRSSGILPRSHGF